MNSDAAKGMREALGLYAKQIPQANGAAAVDAMRNMMGSLFPGSMPAAAAVAIMTAVSANAVASILMEMEMLSSNPQDSADRRAAIIQYWGECLEKTTKINGALGGLALPGLAN